MLERSEDVSGRDFYDQVFRDDLEAEAQWLRFGGSDKVDAIERLLGVRNIRPRSILELGCGTSQSLRSAAVENWRTSMSLSIIHHRSSII